MSARLFFTLFAAIVCAGIVLHWLLNRPVQMLAPKNEIGFKAELERQRQQAQIV